MVSRRLYDGLRSLTMEALEESLSDLIDDNLIFENQLEALLARRDLILMHFARVIAERGESIVLLD